MHSRGSFLGEDENMKVLLLTFYFVVFCIHISGLEINGKVLDAESDRPIPEAEVLFQDIEIRVLTNDSGSFQYLYLQNKSQSRHFLKQQLLKFQNILGSKDA